MQARETVNLPLNAWLVLPAVTATHTHPSQPLAHTNRQIALLRASLRAALTVHTSTISITSWIVRSSPIDDSPNSANVKNFDFL
jgi:hypothetical protein